MFVTILAKEVYQMVKNDLMPYYFHQLRISIRSLLITNKSVADVLFIRNL